MKTRSTWQGCWTAPLKSNSVQRPQLASVSRFFEPYSEAAQELRIRAADRMGEETDGVQSVDPRTGEAQ